MSRLSARSIVLVLAAVLVGLIAVPGTASAAAYRLSPTSFTATGDVIEGWTWLRATGHKAVWTFDAASLSGANNRRVHVNMAALVTNGASGGSGYSATVKLTLVNGAVRQQLSVVLSNPFRPVDPADSHGVGYEAYGSSGSPLSTRLLAGGPTITVTMTYPFTASRHVAVQRSSMVLGYLR